MPDAFGRTRPEKSKSAGRSGAGRTVGASADRLTFAVAWRGFTGAVQLRPGTWILTLQPRQIVESFREHLHVAPSNPMPCR
ncbi:hypothetical protein ACIF85_44925 [Streptomyces sp. NPDC086033]|uniref:hypothetical protein n=1 Tax=Streptomyces sp. NPDC086033 TaxID=3365747 RepID=UPI0037D65CC6